MELRFNSKTLHGYINLALFYLILGLKLLPGSSAEESAGLNYLDQIWIDTIFTERDMHEFESNYGPVQISTSKSSAQVLSYPYTLDPIERKRRYAEYTKLLVEKQRKYREREKETQREREMENDRDQHLEKVLREFEKQEEEMEKERKANLEASNRALKWAAGVLLGIFGLLIILCLLLRCCCRRQHNYKDANTPEFSEEEDEGELPVLNTRGNTNQIVEQREATEGNDLIPPSEPDIWPSASPSNSVDFNKSEEDDPPPKYQDVIDYDTQRMKKSKIPGPSW